MYIKEIHYLDKSCGEADVVISDGTFDLKTNYYCLKANIEVGEIVKEVISFLASNIMRCDKSEYCVEKLKGYYEYHLQGKVLDSNLSIVGIGKIKIKLDRSLPKDILMGEFVEFVVKRLDIFI